MLDSMISSLPVPATPEPPQQQAQPKQADHADAVRFSLVANHLLLMAEHQTLQSRWREYASLLLRSNLIQEDFLDRFQFLREEEQEDVAAPSAPGTTDFQFSSAIPLSVCVAGRPDRPVKQTSIWAGGCIAYVISAALFWPADGLIAAVSGLFGLALLAAAIRTVTLLWVRLDLLFISPCALQAFPV